ncbi:F-box protein SKIP14 [Vitis vinifera]|uniref:F-box protein SKIP14 n=1 Tax=Vitis vinifera TaxID=29760 RepID=A0A438DIW6_VITVI|nr:F-box protein SKIP14 [Vitis vinifera]
MEMGSVSRGIPNREVADCFDYGRDRDDRGGSQQESVSNDILDLLPSDPFGMDISTTFTAITGWLEDLEVDYGGYGTDEIGTSQGNYELFAGLNFIWNNAMRFQALPGKAWLDDKSDIACGFGGFTEEKEVADPSYNCRFGPICVVEDVLSSGNENVCGASCQAEEFREFNGSCYDGDGAAPHAAVSFALGYLGLRDLLSVERVCRSLRATVQSDPLLWRSIHVDQPLNERITDDILLQLTRRAQGNLQGLHLVECPRITDDGLKRVLESNPRLTKVVNAILAPKSRCKLTYGISNYPPKVIYKFDQPPHFTLPLPWPLYALLCVPGCTRLSIEGVVNMLRAFQSTGTPGIKHLRIGGLYGVAHKHFEELKLLLGIDIHEQKNAHKPHFYNRGNFYLLGDDDRAIDIETCPRCQNLRLVYDCPADGCQVKENAAQIVLSSNRSAKRLLTYVFTARDL